MTMFPSHRHHQQNLSKQNRYGGCGGGSSSGDGRTYLSSSGGGGGGCVYHEYCCASDQACVGSDLMAEDESRTESNTNEAGSSSKEVEEKDDPGWLQLSIGGHTNTTSSSSYDHLLKLDQTTTSSSRAGGGRLIELDLLPPGNGGGGGGSVGGSSQQALFRPFNLVPGPVLRPTIFHLPEFRAPPNFPANTSLFVQQHQATPSSSNTTIFPYHQQETNYMAFRTTPGNITPPSSSSSFPNSLVAAPGSYFVRPHSGGGGMEVAGPRLDFRVVEPPRRPQSGVWFMLLASPNQAKEPFLPQIPKSYIRIKDGRMTIRLLIKYLVMKLGLDDESETEITCRGQQLPPFLTLQYVRDNVWRNTASSTTSPPVRNDLVSAVSTLLPHSSATSAATTTDHLMVLHYGRIA